MLALTRKQGQIIYVGKDVVIEVLKLGGGKVRLGIKAPRDVRIDRAEVREQRKADRDGASPAVINISEAKTEAQSC